MTNSAHVTKLVKVKPDDLVELAQRMKSQAMDYAYPGEVVMVPLTAEITLLYEPESEFCKPLTRIGFARTPSVETAVEG
jgi:hypothetical protein